MKQVQILTPSLAALCVSLFANPVLAQSGQDGWDNRAQTVVAARTTSMRAGPQQGYPNVRNIARGGRVTVHGCLDDRSWCDVSYGNDRGWVSGSEFVGRYDGREDSLSNLSVTFRIGTVSFSFGDYWENYYRQRPFYSERYRWEQHYFDNYQSNWGPRPSHSYWGDRRQIGYMLRKSWMRAGPDYDYPSLRRINRNVQVSVYGCLRDWSWCDVGYQRDRGWVPARDLAASYQGRRRSINSVAPYLGIGIVSFSFGIYWNDHYQDRSFYRERDRWEQQYQRNYNPIWGPRQDEGQYRDQQRDQYRSDRTQPRALPPGQWQDQPQPQIQSPGQAEQLEERLRPEAERAKKDKKDKKPKPGDADYERPGRPGDDQ
jgi:uncharacterized protein YraI